MLCDLQREERRRGEEKRELHWSARVAVKADYPRPGRIDLFSPKNKKERRKVLSPPHKESSMARGGGGVVSSISRREKGQGICEHHLGEREPRGFGNQRRTANNHHEGKKGRGGRVDL